MSKIQFYTPILHPPFAPGRTSVPRSPLGDNAELAILLLINNESAKSAPASALSRAAAALVGLLFIEYFRVPCESGFCRGRRCGRALNECDSNEYPAEYRRGEREDAQSTLTVAVESQSFDNLLFTQSPCVTRRQRASRPKYARYGH